MINNDSKNTKLHLLIDKIKSIDSKYGYELCQVLLSRVEIKTNQFFEDFEQRSKKSFNLYWDKISELNNRFDVSEFSEKNVNVNEKIIPKFIEEFEKKNKK